MLRTNKSLVPCPTPVPTVVSFVNLNDLSHNTNMHFSHAWTGKICCRWVLPNTLMELHTAIFCSNSLAINSITTTKQCYSFLCNWCIIWFCTKKHYSHCAAVIQYASSSNLLYIFTIHFSAFFFYIYWISIICTFFWNITNYIQDCQNLDLGVSKPICPKMLQWPEELKIFL